MCPRVIAQPGMLGIRLAIHRCCLVLLLFALGLCIAARNDDTRLPDLGDGNTITPKIAPPQGWSAIRAAWTEEGPFLLPDGEPFAIGASVQGREIVAYRFGQGPR